ncbi:uncharacterized protein LOC143201430 isoform X12 [Rhynchophorus ferrugineus]|uniref:uncharacterized protein LOC143201430 isoform X12 n=1 Tax=Rhynchophorus ferrugineus TaxID=354439 RepID=UPI003FCD2595
MVVNYPGIGVGISVGVLCLALIYKVRKYIKTNCCAQPQDQNVFNISSRVQGQEQRHPDAFVSLEHITIMNELNKPPKYDDAPPSYEEAIKIAMAQDNSLKTFQTEVAASQGTSSSSSAAATSSAATPQIQPAIPNRTE